MTTMEQRAECGLTSAPKAAAEHFARSPRMDFRSSKAKWRAAPISLSASASAADKVDDFKLVAGADRCFDPGCAGNNFAVLLKGDTVILETESRDEIGDL